MNDLYGHPKRPWSWPFIEKCVTQLATVPFTMLSQRRTGPLITSGRVRLMLRPSPSACHTNRLWYCSGIVGAGADGQGKSTQLLADAMRLLDVTVCDEKAATLAIRLAQLEAEKQLALALKDANMQFLLAEARREGEGQMAVLRYKYASVSSRFWLERLFRDIVSFAGEKQWTQIESMYDANRKWSMKGVNKYLQTHASRWQEFVVAHDLHTVMRNKFPKLPNNTLLYGALSDEIHNPPEFCVLKLPDESKSKPYLVLLRDLGRHYQKKDGLSVSTIDIGRAMAEIIKDSKDGYECDDD